MSQQSTVDIRDSKFIGIRGLYGAALMISASNIMITRNNTFVGNVASAGGSVYLYDSVLKLNGTNHFMNNTSHGQRRIFDSVCDYNTTTTYIRGGGAIACIESTLTVNGYSLFERNAANSILDGGAIAARDGTISFYGSVSFYSNYAHHGGAMLLGGTSLELYGNVPLENNSAKLDCGALHIIYESNVSFSGNHHTLSVTSHDTVTPITMVLFRQNKAIEVGGAISTGSTNNILIFTGNIMFIAN